MSATWVGDIFLSVQIFLTNNNFSPGRSCMQCMATKKKCATTKEESKKVRRVYAKGMETAGGKKQEKGKGKEMESRKKWKRDEEN